MEKNFIAYANSVKHIQTQLANTYIKRAVDAENKVDGMRTTNSEHRLKQSLPLQIAAFNEQYYRNLQQKFNPYTRNQVQANVGTSLKRFQNIALKALAQK